MKRLFNYLLAFICVSFMYTFVGCDCSHNGYKRITVTNELGSYSFEYPSCYGMDIQDNLDFDIPYTHLVLLGPMKHEKTEVFDPDTGEVTTVVGERMASVFYVDISNYKIYYGESYSATNRLERVLEGEAKWANYQLLERAPLTVSGIEGEMVAYLVDKLMPIPVEDGENLEYVCAVYFDYNNFTWKIEAKCNQDMMDEVRADFDHIVETFTILD
jgi:hypothetical protein